VGFAALLGQAGRKAPVLAVARSLPAGHVLVAGDLRKVELGVDDAAGHVVPAADAGSVVGQVAAVPLAAGSLLAPGQVGESSQYPPAVRAQVSFAVEAGAVPAGLVAGQRAAVLAGSPDAAGAPKDGAEVKDDPLVGVVTDVTAGEGESAPVVVTLLVDTAAARRAASRPLGAYSAEVLGFRFAPASSLPDEAGRQDRSASDCSRDHDVVRLTGWLQVTHFQAAD
jgi:hypothetical protein